MLNEELWQTVLAEIQLNTSRANFITWFKGTEIVSVQDGVVTVAVPNNFSKEWLENKYNKAIFKILRDFNEGLREIKFVISPKEIKTPPFKKSQIAPVEETQLGFEELKVNKETNLNPRYTFESFVVGSFNELAHAAASAVSKSPGQTYNPLFIYGGVGLGKTHLLQAVGNEVVKKIPGKIVKYIPSEIFTSQVITSIKNHKIEDLKEQYRQVDVLIIDDIQFLAGKEKTQEEFFHIFNALYEKNKQIIISSDRPPKAIPALEERLRSRFEGGMIADVSSPDLETRIAILKTKAQEKNMALPGEILNYLATLFQKNIRELEGSLNKLALYLKQDSQDLSLDAVKNIFQNLALAAPKITSFKKILQAVVEFYDLKERDLLNNSRRKEIVRPRQIAMYLLREELKFSYPSIGRKFGGKDHTTAIYACEKINRETKSSETLLNEINLIKQRIYSV